MASANAQLVVIYSAPHGEVRPYASAYNEDQAKHQLVACRRLHGNGCNARVVSAKEYPPNVLRGMTG